MKLIISQIEMSGVGIRFGIALMLLLVSSSSTARSTSSLPCQSGHWCSDTARWLKASYVINDREAAFASIDARNLENPSLYATYPALGIYRNAGKDISNSTAIVSWLTTLRSDEGYYDDPNLALDRTVESYWAIKSLEWLNKGSIDEGVITFAKKIVKEQLPLTTDDVDLASRYTNALEILNTFDAINEEIVLIISDLHMKSSASNPCGFLSIAIINSIYSFDKSLVSKEDTESIFMCLDNTIKGDLGITSLQDFNRLVETSDLIDHQRFIKMRDAVKSFVELEILGESITSLRVDLISQYWRTDQVNALEIAKLIGFLEPELLMETELDSLENDRIGEGWPLLPIREPNIEATYYALSIAREIGDTGYNEDYIDTYAKRIYRESCDVKDINKLGYSLMVMNILNKRIDNTNDNCIRDVIQLDDPLTVRNLGIKDISNIIDIYEISKSEIPSAFVNETQSKIQMYPVSGLNLRDVYYISKIQYQLRRKLINNDDLLNKIDDFMGRDGGFMAKTGADKSDMTSTFYGVYSLRFLGRTDKIDKTKLTQFLETTRFSRGYAFYPTDRSSHVALHVTKQALDILRAVSSLYSVEPTEHPSAYLPRAERP